MIISILVVGIIGLLIGILLSLASIKFEVKVDENEEKIRQFFQVIIVGLVAIQDVMDLLVPLLKKKHPSINCPVGGEEVAKK